MVSVGHGTEGYLWEGGKQVLLAEHLPAELQGQITNLQPYALSNQTAPGTDATIYLLAGANVTQPDGTVTNDATIVCTRDNDGIWSFAQVGLPSGMIPDWYQATINASGELAFTGYDDDGSSGGSGQTAATSTQAVQAGQGPGGTPQPAQTPSNAKQAYIGVTASFDTTKPGFSKGPPHALMVPVDGQNTLDKTVISKDGVGSLAFYSDNTKGLFSVEPSHATSTKMSIDVHGGAKPGTGNLYAVPKGDYDTPQALSKSSVDSVAVDVKLSQTLNVTVHAISLPGLAAPKNVPTPESLTREAEKVLGAQANTHLNVTVQSHVCAYDTSASGTLGDGDQLTVALWRMARL